MHRARWWKEQPLAYQLTVSKLCFCDTGVPWISRIEDFRVTSSSGGYDRNGESIGPPLRSVEQLFREADRAVHSNAEEVSVTFDPRFSYPTRISIDNLRDAVDDELEWIAELTVLGAN